MDVYGLKLDDVKAGLRRLLPMLEVVSRVTANKVDDAAVAFLRAWLEATEK
jgi:hypothetical protein